MSERRPFIRYPGGKQRFVNEIVPYLPSDLGINGRFVEPFLGGGAIFFEVNPPLSLLSDLNSELIDLYRGIRRAPHKVWETFKNFPETKEGYYSVRSTDLSDKSLVYKAARTLFLNRTCFKGMWRHNSIGKFNVGYGGQSRRWVIDEPALVDVSQRLARVDLRASDFEPILDESEEKDFIFLDPPYKPGERDLKESHYAYGRFKYLDHLRLSKSLGRATERGVKWALTVSSHPDLLELYRNAGAIMTQYLPRGTGVFPGIITDDSKEVLLLNYESERGVGN